MPYDYDLNAYYKIDYNKAKETLTSIYSVFGTPFLNYISEWLFVLEKLDTAMSINDIDEYYGYKYTLIDKNIFSVNFNVSLITKALDNNIIPFEFLSVPLTSFGTEGRKYQYTYETDPTNSSNPVIVTKVPTLTTHPEVISQEFVVIDGNHRVSEAKRRGTGTIKVQRINKDSLIHSDTLFFLSTYDKFLYAFLTELTEAPTAIKWHHITPETFTNKSFLFCFDKPCL